MELESIFLSSKLDKKQIAKSEYVRSNAENLLQCIIVACPNCREKSLAITKLEECVMWANKSISRNAEEE